MEENNTQQQTLQPHCIFLVFKKPSFCQRKVGTWRKTTAKPFTFLFMFFSKKTQKTLKHRKPSPRFFELVFQTKNSTRPKTPEPFPRLGVHYRLCEDLDGTNSVASFNWPGLVVYLGAVTELRTLIRDPKDGPVVLASEGQGLWLKCAYGSCSSTSEAWLALEFRGLRFLGFGGLGFGEGLLLGVLQLLDLRIWEILLLFVTFVAWLAKSCLSDGTMLADT